MGGRVPSHASFGNILFTEWPGGPCYSPPYLNCARAQKARD